MDESSATRFHYYKSGRVKATVKTVDNVDYRTETEYDAMGRVSAVTYPHRVVNGVEDPAAKVFYQYDSLGNLHEVDACDSCEDLSQAVAYARYDGYNALGQVQTVTRQNGGADAVTTTYAYYPQNHRLHTVVTEGAGATLQNLQYDYCDNGNVETITDHMDPLKTQSFVYDDLNRLTTASSPSYKSWDITFAYDILGNITRNTKVGPGNYVYASHNPTPQPHAVTAAGSLTFEYDYNGNMVKENGGARTFQYDAENRVKSITAGGSTVEFVYDYKGERVKKIPPAGAPETLYLGGLMEISGARVTRHISAGGSRIATKKAQNLFSIHADHLGGLNVATSTAGAEKQRNTYYPFGETNESSGTAGLHHKFTGQEEDPETGLTPRER